MPKRSKPELAAEAVFRPKTRKALPFEFVLEALAELHPTTRLMFGCVAVYVGERIVLILRDRPTHPADNGVWLATTSEHHASLKRQFPNMRSIGFLKEGVTQWQVLPADAADFEESAMRACDLVLARDPRVGKVPNSKVKKKVPRKRDALR